MTEIQITLQAEDAIQLRGSLILPSVSLDLVAENRIIAAITVGLSTLEAQKPSAKAS